MTADAVKILADAIIEFGTKLQLLASEMSAGGEAVASTEPEALKPKKPAKVKTEQPTPTATAEAEPESPPESPTITEDDVRRVLGEKSRKGFTAQAKALLTKYGVKQVSELSPEHYVAVIAEAEGIK